MQRVSVRPKRRLVRAPMKHRKGIVEPAKNQILPINQLNVLTESKFKVSSPNRPHNIISPKAIQKPNLKKSVIQRKCNVERAKRYYKYNKAGKRYKWSPGLAWELYKVVRPRHYGLYAKAKSKRSVGESFIKLVCLVQKEIGWTVSGKIGGGTIAAWKKWKDQQKVKKYLKDYKKKESSSRVWPNFMLRHFINRNFKKLDKLKLIKSKDFQEKKHKDRLRTSAIIRKTRRHINALSSAKEQAGYFSKLAEYHLFFTQRKNLNVLFKHKGTPAWKITCNVTSLAMVLANLGKTSVDFVGSIPKLQMIADQVVPKKERKEKVTDYRFADFLQLISIYYYLAGDANKRNFARRVEKARKTAAIKKHFGAQFFHKIIQLFGAMQISNGKVNGKTLEVYKANAKKTLQPKLNAGELVIIAYVGHFMVLQGFVEDSKNKFFGFKLYDPYFSPGRNRKISWHKAYHHKTKKGTLIRYFASYYSFK